MIKSRLFLPLLSTGAQKNFETLSDKSPCDNVLLEYNLALELKERHLCEFIIPVMIGQKSGVTYDGYSRPNLKESGDVIVESVITKLREHLGRMGLGSLLLPPMSIKSIYDKITINQGNFISGDFQVAISHLRNDILGLLKPAQGVNLGHTEKYHLEDF